MGEAPVVKQPFVVVSGMISSADNVPSTGPDRGSSAQTDEISAGEMTAENLLAEAETKAVDTATKAPDTPPLAAAHAVELDQGPREVLRVGVAGSRSISGDDSAASVADSGWTPAKAADVHEPKLGDLAADVATTETNDNVDELPDSLSPDSLSLGGEKTKKGTFSTEEPSGEAKIETNAETKPVRPAVDLGASLVVVSFTCMLVIFCCGL